jgi:uncharacterized protein (TIGR02996 family)
MSERDAFLAAIRARPNDDLPRLVFADWLDDHGENARAEFIRLQCELARAPEPNGCADTCECPPCLARTALRRRERALLDGPAWEWSGLKGYWPVVITEVWPPSLRPAAYADAVAVRFRRGFVEEVACSRTLWLVYSDVFRRATPIRKVWLTALPTSEFGGLTGPRDDEAISRELQDEFPDIEFELPPLATPDL